MNNIQSENQLTESSIQLNIQMQDIINQCSKTYFSTPIKILGNATLGQHFRHIIEFYLELFNGIPSGKINYENRKRDQLIETDPAYTISKLNTINEILGTVSPSARIQLITHYSTSIQDQKVFFNTSIGRELIYAFDHSIHHLAIIRIGLQSEFPHIRVPENLGVAPSTIRFREECAR